MNMFGGPTFKYHDFDNAAPCGRHGWWCWWCFRTAFNFLGSITFKASSCLGTCHIQSPSKIFAGVTQNIEHQHLWFPGFLLFVPVGKLDFSIFQMFLSESLASMTQPKALSTLGRKVRETAWIGRTHPGSAWWVVDSLVVATLHIMGLRYWDKSLCNWKSAIGNQSFYFQQQYLLGLHLWVWEPEGTSGTTLKHCSWVAELGWCRNNVIPLCTTGTSYVRGRPLTRDTCIVAGRWQVGKAGLQLFSRAWETGAG